MTGTILNAVAIVAGGVAGLLWRRQLSLAHQNALKVILGALTVYVGLSLTWRSTHGTFLQVLGQLGIMLLALMLGNVTGKLLRLQSSLNRLGAVARDRINQSPDPGPRRVGDGFLAGSILFCVSPLAFLGPCLDGLLGYWAPLGVKAAMDALATLALVTLLGSGLVLSVVPVVALLGTVTLLARLLEPFLASHDLLGSIGTVGGLLVFCVSLIILEIRKVALADYLPSLVYAPLLTWFLR